MRSNALIITLVFVFLAASAAAQPMQVASSVHDVYKIESAVLGEERTILVRVPAAYGRGNTRFPVLYMLDAHAPQNVMAVGIVEQQAWGGQMPEMIVVGILNTARVRDMTPTRVADRAGSGGLDKFLDFIEKEVIPLVEKNYRTEPFRVFAGHSLAGLAAVYTFVSRPDMFNAYIAASPFLHWDNNFVTKLAAEKFKANGNRNKTLYVALGDEPAYTNGHNAFRNLLKNSFPKGLAFEYQVFQNENHGSIVLPAYYGGLRKVFAGWPPPQNGTMADIESHYKRLTARFGYPILIPEAFMNRAGYDLLNANRIDEAIAVFRKNVDTYPNSANTYDSLAEAYEKAGQLKRSIENYEKAFKMAESNGETQLAAAAKANFERLRTRSQ